MEYKLKWPDVKGRKEIKAIDVKYGDVVAVAEFYRNSFTNEIEFGSGSLTHTRPSSLHRLMYHIAQSGRCNVI